jgi:hypothetical protein
MPLPLRLFKRALEIKDMANKKRAKDEIMGKLHEKLAAELLKRVESGEASSQDLNAAIKFLQNNGIQGEVEADESMKKLSVILPQFWTKMSSIAQRCKRSSQARLSQVPIS